MAFGDLVIWRSGDFDVRLKIAVVSVIGTALALAIGVPPSLSAQQNAQVGQVIGTVTDSRHGALPGATVALSGPALPQPRTTLTDAKGNYEFKDVPLGTYGLYFGSSGFRDFMHGDVVIKDGNVVQVAAQLDVADPHACGGSLVAEAPGALHYGQTRVGIKTELGDIEIVVDGERAPITTQNFLKYVTGHFYDGGDFHRTTRPDNYTMLLPNRPMMRIIQGGINPARRSEAFPPIPLERTSVTKITHHCGTVSMARGTVDTATSDFFICLDDQPSLDFGGKRFDDAQGAAAFGHVVKGLDVVQKINGQPAQGQNLTPPIKILSAAVIK
jgi:peptidyl-prolyl cis-trans isomerase A (cyclophilin A)